MTRAQYPGVCSVCGQPINPGDLIADRHHAWAHQACAARGKE